MSEFRGVIERAAFTTGIEAARQMALTAAVTIEVCDDAREIRQQAAAAALQGFAEGLRSLSHLAEDHAVTALLPASSFALGFRHKPRARVLV
ncbi:hypothetical protein FOHLNKBM_5530 [Methylobacterium longum]|uniref:hypothetical protein n=1 Tax=Methylobacterium longum TaxID=767694 RepID=UPI001EE1EC1A|nr:hypothetical protein [Methylobacterium longum]GJE14455.1 hypothetical protein FOHLNKBM_5530 [Methylobacterium longum]